MVLRDALPVCAGLLTDSAGVLQCLPPPAIREEAHSGIHHSSHTPECMQTSPIGENAHIIRTDKISSPDGICGC